VPEPAAAGLLAGAAIFIKSVAVFVMAPALAALALSSRGLRALRDPQVWILAVLAVIPYGIYHINGVYIQGYLVGQFSGRFFPEMWIDPAFYLRWLSNLSRVMPFEMVLAAILGIFVIRRRTCRALLLAQWIGYIAYGMALSHHISTHDYYHLLIFPAVALGLAGLGEAVISRLTVPALAGRVAAASLLVAGLVVNGYDARNTLKRYDAASEARNYEEIGKLLGEQASVVALAPDYGVGLKYWGWINPLLWPTTDDIRYRISSGEQIEFAKLFAEQAAGRHYFVITALDDFAEQPELKIYLDGHYSILQETPGYLIYDLR